jgi:hypothetical protein
MLKEVLQLILSDSMDIGLETIRLSRGNAKPVVSLGFPSFIIWHNYRCLECCEEGF